MILNALYEYAGRNKNLSESGFQNNEFKFLIKIREDGSFVEFMDLRQNDADGKERGKNFCEIPKRVGRTSGIKSSLLWDKIEYVLADEKNDEKKREAFVAEIENLPEKIKAQKEISAVINFYRANKSNGLDKSLADENFAEVKKSKTDLSFILEFEDAKIVAQNEDVKNFWRASLDENDDGEANEGVCLITGEKSKLARLHDSTKIFGGKATPRIVSFQTSRGFDSFGKKQAFNAPVSQKAMLAYTKSLNYLLKSKENRLRLGNDTIVFWAEKECEFEKNFSSIFDFEREDDPDKNIAQIKNLLKSVQTGNYEELESNFYLLGLSPNSGRISIRFWETGKISLFAERIKQHFDDFEIIHGKNQKEFLSISAILKAIVLNGDVEKIPPKLSGEVIRSVFKGIQYPAQLRLLCMNRIRADRKVSRAQAAILKAYMNRLSRKNKREEISVALNRENKNVGYLIGRLFAVLEKIQNEALGDLNATITDRYYGAASTNPRTVFPQLLKLKNFHLAKIEKEGLKIAREKEIGEIMNGIDSSSSFPAHLNLDGQTMFALGYYHERESFFQKNNDNEQGE